MTNFTDDQKKIIETLAGDGKAYLTNADNFNPYAIKVEIGTTTYIAADTTAKAAFESMKYALENR